MTPRIVLFCKSYRDDVLRLARLAQSVVKYNDDSLPFYVSVPDADIALFQEKCGGLPIEFVTDEQIVAANPAIDYDMFTRLPGGIAQQIVKSEFWRLNKADNYLCLDSDCYFIKPFRTDDFIARDGTPYTVMHESKEFLLFAELAGMKKISRDRIRTYEGIASQFGRQGHLWDFGPIPVVWSNQVWRDLDERYLRPKGMTIVEAFEGHPSELQWYGEALLAHRSIPIYPIEPLFRCYHYEEQYAFWKKIGETEDIVAVNYLGIVAQSNWDKRLDLVRKFKFSSLRRSIKRALKI